MYISTNTKMNWFPWSIVRISYIYTKYKHYKHDEALCGPVSCSLLNPYLMVCRSLYRVDIYSIIYFGWIPKDLGDWIFFTPHNGFAYPMPSYPQVLRFCTVWPPWSKHHIVPYQVYRNRSFSNYQRAYTVSITST